MCDHHVKRQNWLMKTVHEGARELSKSYLIYQLLYQTSCEYLMGHRCQIKYQHEDVCQVFVVVFFFFCKFHNSLKNV